MAPRYKCCICKGTVPHSDAHEHPLDPCGLLIVGNIDRDWRDQKEQTFYCHFECFRRVVGDDSCLYIADADFATNGENADERVAEETAENAKHTHP